MGSAGLLVIFGITLAAGGSFFFALSESALFALGAWRARQLAEHSSEGSAYTMRGVQKRRPSLYELVDKIRTITAPTLVMTGDEDWPCLEPGLLMKSTIASAGLIVMPNAGHTINLEDPAAFNQHLADFFHAVDAGAWRNRDPRAMQDAILGR